MWSCERLDVEKESEAAREHPSVGETVDMKQSEGRGKQSKPKPPYSLGRGAGRPHLRDTADPSDRAPSPVWACLGLATSGYHASAAGTRHTATEHCRKAEHGAWSLVEWALHLQPRGGPVDTLDQFLCAVLLFLGCLGPRQDKDRGTPNPGRGRRKDGGWCMPRIQGYHGGMYLYVDLGSLSVGGTSNLGVGRCSLVPSYKVSVWTRPLGEQGITYLMDKLLDFRLTSLSIIVNSRP